METEFDIDMSDWFKHCPECGKELLITSLYQHLKSLHHWNADDWRASDLHAIDCPACGKPYGAAAMTVHVYNLHIDGAHPALTPRRYAPELTLDETIRCLRQVQEDRTFTATAAQIRSLKRYGLISNGSPTHATTLGRRLLEDPSPDALLEAFIHEPVFRLAYRMHEHGHATARIFAHLLERRVILREGAAREYDHVFDANLALLDRPTERHEPAKPASKPEPEPVTEEPAGETDGLMPFDTVLVNRFHGGYARLQVHGSIPPDIMSRLLVLVNSFSHETGADDPATRPDDAPRTDAAQPSAAHVPSPSPDRVDTVQTLLP
ncbi:hypothetical protein BISA_1869 [Bifidobacterium saguini DSM 23967]|uniref:Uncharacterized protein n=1 Tax=Bifidobacterium saguini DSM 23967 TaxID=1437607 RepID=A0A087D6X0_9BIFI|nr:hypothetical protein [Bifidobacterium saguini]KFI91270.1 hypothetical protein BISA_1869 [Bifidobacterium saguini DSM 23967]